MITTLALAAGMAGCAGVPTLSADSGPSRAQGSSTQTGTTPPQASAAAPTPSVTSTAPSGAPTKPTVAPATTQLAGTMETALKAAAQSKGIPDQEQLRASLVAAGIPAATLEVSVSRTPTGLDVDAIEAAARTESDCVIGQIRDGAVTVGVLPVLASGKCFVGDSR